MKMNQHKSQNKILNTIERPEERNIKENKKRAKRNVNGSIEYKKTSSVFTRGERKKKHKAKSTNGNKIANQLTRQRCM